MTQTRIYRACSWQAMKKMRLPLTASNPSSLFSSNYAYAWNCVGYPLMEIVYRVCVSDILPYYHYERYKFVGVGSFIWTATISWAAPLCSGLTKRVITGYYVAEKWLDFYIFYGSAVMQEPLSTGNNLHTIFRQLPGELSAFF